jgi:ABC-type nitrate/sulfonate/bicarbonate transport system substrate-binding protein
MRRHASGPARAAAAVVLAAVLAVPGASAGSPAATATMLWVAVTGSQAVAWVTKEGGYFTRSGVDVALDYISGSPTAAAVLVGGRVDFVQMAGPAVVAADARGAHLVMVMGFVTQPAFVVVTAPEIQTPEQLRGKTVAVVKVGSSDDFMLREALTHWGMRPDADVKITGVGSVAAQLAALSKRLVDAAVFDPPNDVVAVRAGARVLVRVADLGVPYQAAGLVTSREYIKSHGDIVAKVVRAMTEGVHRIKTDRIFAEEVMAKYLKSTDPVIVNAAYDSYAPVFSMVPLPSKAGLQEIAKEYLATGQVTAPLDVSPMLDTSFVDALQRSGFIKRLYGR